MGANKIRVSLGVVLLLCYVLAYAQMDDFSFDFQALAKQDDRVQQSELSQRDNAEAVEYLMGNLIESEQHEHEWKLQESSLSERIFDKQKTLAQAHEHEKYDYSILKNNVFRSEKIRIFNNMAYKVDFESLKNSFNQDQQGGIPINLNSIKFGFGYGLEYQLNKLNYIGYEYISGFPDHDAQMIRLFWNRIIR